MLQKLTHHRWWPFAHYTLLAGTGWVLDLSVFIGLTSLHVLDIFAANLWSSALGASWLFLTSQHRLFMYRGHFLWPKLAVFLGYSVAIILLISWLIDTLTLVWGAPAWLIKVGLTAATFVTNYFILKNLLLMFENKG